MYALRDHMAAESGMGLIVHKNPEAVERGVNPFDHGSTVHTDMWKTQGLKQALDLHGFDAAIGGARRDEQASRAKERVFSFQGPERPALWSLYNPRVSPGETMRVLALSNWTALDVWDYIAAENIPVVNLYFAAPRPVVTRGGALSVVDDERMRLNSDETPQTRTVRFRTLGCYPLSGAIESEATTLDAVIAEMRASRSSEP